MTISRGEPAGAAAVEAGRQDAQGASGRRQFRVRVTDLSTGRNKGTLNGTFRILDKIAKAWSDPWGFWMPDWMGIYYAGSDIENGIHALPVTTGGKTLWSDFLGKPVSYGCVVLSNHDASTLFAWAEIGTTVEIRQ